MAPNGLTRFHDTRPVVSKPGITKRRATTATGAVTFEFKKIENARIKRAARKARSAALPQNEDFKCPQCGKCFLARIGHHRTRWTKITLHYKT